MSLKASNLYLEIHDRGSLHIFTWNCSTVKLLWLLLFGRNMNADHHLQQEKFTLQDLLDSVRKFLAPGIVKLILRCRG